MSVLRAVNEEEEENACAEGEQSDDDDQSARKCLHITLFFFTDAHSEGGLRNV